MVPGYTGGSGSNGGGGGRGGGGGGHLVPHLIEPVPRSMKPSTKVSATSTKIHFCMVPFLLIFFKNC